MMIIIEEIYFLFCFLTHQYWKIDNMMMMIFFVIENIEISLSNLKLSIVWIIWILTNLFLLSFDDHHIIIFSLYKNTHGIIIIIMIAWLKVDWLITDVYVVVVVVVVDFKCMYLMMMLATNNNDMMMILIYTHSFKNCEKES